MTSDQAHIVKTDHRRAAQRGNSSALMLFLIAFFVLVGLGIWVAYTYGEGYIVIGDRTVSELQPWEVAGAVVIGIVGLVIGLIGGAIGLLVGLAAMILSLVLGVIGVAAGLFIAAGTLLGPFLLLAAIILLIRRQPKDDEDAKAKVKGSMAPAGDAVASARADMWVS